MKPNEALEILVKAVGIAQSKGAFNLAEAKIICEAVETFSQKAPETPVVTEGEKAPLPAKEEVTDGTVSETPQA